MKMRTLTFGYALAIALSATAQSMKMYNGASFDKASPNGKWLVENIAGTMTIYDVANDKTYSLPENSKDTEMYSPGLGNSVANSGKICGFSMTKDAFIWNNGTVNYDILEQPTGHGTSFNGAQSFSSDEKYIVGALGWNNASLSGSSMMAYPVIWTLNDNNTYSCTTLPYLAKDFAKATPQYVIALVVSDDGCTVGGNLVSGNGRYKFPIIFKKNDAGEWSYTLLGKTEIYDESRLSELPDLPIEPVEPNYEDYMSESDIATYNAAMEYYEEQLDLYNQGIIDAEPAKPIPGSYISDTAKLAEYTADVQDYVAKQKEFVAAQKKYQAALDNITTGQYFSQNNFFLSANGRYLAASLCKPTGITTPGYFDLSESDPKFVEMTNENYSMLVTGILNDGTIFAATPVTDVTRDTYVIKNDGNKTPVSFYDYLLTRSAVAAQWLKDNNTYTTENGEAIVSGTVHTNADGTVFTSYYTDLYTDDNQTRKSYVIDLTATTGIDNIKGNAQTKATVAVNGKTLSLEGNAKVADVYDMSGRKIAKVEGSANTKMAVPGIYVVKTTAIDGSKSTQKIVIK